MKYIKNLIYTLPLLLALLVLIPSVSAQDNGEDHKIVFQLTDNDQRSHKALTNQLKNLKKGWPQAQFEVVVHSAGISYLQKSRSQFSAEIKALSELGVVFKACENTLDAKNIPKTDILNVAEFVPMGIAAIVLRQEEGWSYIKAGL